MFQGKFSRRTSNLRIGHKPGKTHILAPGAFVMSFQNDSRPATIRFFEIVPECFLLDAAPYAILAGYLHEPVDETVMVTT